MVISSVNASNNVLLFATNLVVMPYNGKYCKTLTLYIGKGMSWHHLDSNSSSFLCFHYGASLACIHFVICEGYAFGSRYKDSICETHIQGSTFMPMIVEVCSGYNKDLCKAFEWTTFVQPVQNISEEERRVENFQWISWLTFEGSSLQGEEYVIMNHTEAVTKTSTRTSKSLMMGDLTGMRLCLNAVILTFTWTHKAPIRPPSAPIKQKIGTSHR